MWVTLFITLIILNHIIVISIPLSRHIKSNRSLKIFTVFLCLFLTDALSLFLDLDVFLKERFEYYRKFVENSNSNSWSREYENVGFLFIYFILWRAMFMYEIVGLISFWASWRMLQLCWYRPTIKLLDFTYYT